MEKECYIFSLALRILFLIYGIWQDATMAVKFTDVDYYVFTDASRLVTEGQSPFLRSTYRYTPLLAWVLTPSIWLTPVFGKLIFIAFDICVGHVIYNILHRLGKPTDTCKKCALIWLLNPLCITVSSRGNAESVIAWLVLMSLSYLLQGQVIPSAIFYGLSVHFKIYPITFAVPIYLYLGSPKIGHAGSNKNHNQKPEAVNLRGSQTGWTYLKNFLWSILPNRDRITFIFVSFGVLGGLTAFFYSIYGWPFLYETYLYHVIRGDIRHNFSPYFYLLYLTSTLEGGVPLCLRLLVFLPQALLLIALAFKFQRHPSLAWFLSVFVFVMFNKVCTSQYFLWYLSLVPLVIPDLDMTLPSLAGLLALWLGGQACWLFSAYLLEFQGSDMFLPLWASSLGFLIANAFIVHFIITSYKPCKNKQP